MSTERGTPPPLDDDVPIINERSPLRATSSSTTEQQQSTDEGGRRSTHPSYTDPSHISPPRVKGEPSSSASSTPSQHQRRASDLRPNLGAGRTLITESGINIHRPDYDDIERAAAARREDNYGYGGIPYPPSLTSVGTISPSTCSSEPSFGKQMTMLLLVSIYPIYTHYLSFLLFTPLSLCANSPKKVSVLPFGGHFVKNCLTSLEFYMVNDPRLNLTETRYGLLLSMTSLPNFFIPFLGGR